MASRCSPAAPLRSAASAKRRSSRCRARRIRRSRRGGRWRFPCWIGYRAGGRASRLSCRWRARLPPASASPRSCCCKRKQDAWVHAGGRRLVARCYRPRRSMARGARRRRRFCGGQRRSMPICCGNDMGSGMTNTPLAEKPRQHRAGPVPDHPVARGGAGALRSRAVSALGSERTAAAGRCARLRAGAGRRRADRRAAVRSLQCRWLCGAFRRSGLGRRGDAGPPDAQRRSDRLRHRADAAGAVGNGDLDCDRRSGAARRRRHRDGRAYPARRPPRDRDPPRRFARAIRILCRLRHRARRDAVARRHRDRLARDRHAGGLRHRAGVGGAPAARRGDLHRRRTGAAGPAAAPRRDLRHQRRHRHRGDPRERRRGGISRRHCR